MKTLEYFDVRDRSRYGKGPWDNEPDKKQWLDPKTKLPCLIVRNHSGALCGYVGVSKDHRCFGKHYDEVSDDIDANVHGGLTFSDKCHTGSEALICHTVEEGEDGNVWWLGFDCAHAFDLMPIQRFLDKLVGQSKKDYFKELQRDDLFIPDTYKDIAYVTQQCQSLAKQLKAAV